MQTEYKMTPAIQRVLCNLIGECEHKWVPFEGLRETYEICEKCELVKSRWVAPSFTTPADAHKVMKAVKGKGRESDHAVL